MEKTIHQGRNVKHFREVLNIKQAGLAAALGSNWDQRKVSMLEQREKIDEDILDQIAEALKVPADMLKNHDMEAAVVNIQHNYEGSSANANGGSYHNFSFNPIDKVIELYEALLKSEREKTELLQKVMDRLK